MALTHRANLVQSQFFSPFFQVNIEFIIYMSNIL